MLQDVHAVAGLTPRTAYLVHTPDAAPSPRTFQRWGSSIFQGPMLPALPTDLAESNTPCASSTFVHNLHLLALVLPFPFPSTGRPLDCAFLNLVGSVIS